MRRKKGRSLWLSAVSALILGLALPPAVGAQYFGQNKVQYRSFDFMVLETEHFDLHYYPEEAETAEYAARLAERWYARLSGLLGHTLAGRQVLVLYASHPEFRQTNVISGLIGEATGGVTEGLHRRIVLPAGPALPETSHVIGHELVHAFQYDIASANGSGGGVRGGGLQRLPLWFVEGMAEYLSLGSMDPHTAMWMRDAVLFDNLPAVDDLADPEFFPYRFGQAFWSYVAGRWGDTVVGELLRTGSRARSLSGAIESVLGVTTAELSEDWHAALREHYRPALEGAGREVPGTRVVGPEQAGEIAVSPSVSPDGRRVVFYSGRELYSIEMFMADVETGEIIRKITDAAIDPHLESLGFVSSTGAWSPDGTRFAYGVVAGGRPRLRIIEAESGDVVRDAKLAELGETFNPTWSPDGMRVAFSAIRGGQTDLYVLDLDSGSVEQLTDDAFSALHPAWSPDGARIAFVTDRFSTDLGTLDFGNYRVALYEVEGGGIREIPNQPRGRHTNPQWAGDGSSLYVISDADGAPNVYALDPETGASRRLTDLATGASGITALSPALSVAADDTMIASVYLDGEYRLVRLEPDPTPGATGSPRTGTLPPAARATETVNAFLAGGEGPLPPVGSFQRSEYDAGLSLDFVAPPSVGVGFSGFGTSVGGGTSLYFSDILGSHNLITGFQIQTDGEHIQRDLAAVAQYENRDHRWIWGLTGGQSPFVSGRLQTSVVATGDGPVLVEEQTRLWEIHRELTGLAAYPFNRAQRIEFLGGFEHLSFARELDRRAFFLPTGQLIAQEEMDLDAPASLRFGTAGAALVYDTTVAGGLGPLRGVRYRIEGRARAGSLYYNTALLDYRSYFMPLRPMTLAFRLLHYGRYGGDSGDGRLQDFFIGDSSLVRGYEVSSFEAGDCAGAPEGTCPVFDRLIGSRLGVASAEVRLPLLGPLGVASESFLPVEVAAFFDAGTAWGNGLRPDWLGGERHTVTSHGVSMRINLVGLAIGQVNFVHPNDRPARDWIWEFNLVPTF